MGDDELRSVIRPSIQLLLLYQTQGNLINHTFKCFMDVRHCSSYFLCSKVVVLVVPCWMKIVLLVFTRKVLFFWSSTLNFKFFLIRAYLKSVTLVVNFSGISHDNKVHKIGAGPVLVELLFSYPRPLQPLFPVLSLIWYTTPFRK